MNKPIETHHRQHRAPPESFAGSNIWFGEEKIETYGLATGELILEPAEVDILCSKDKTFRRHAGNRAFKEFIATYAKTYHEATRQDKMAITEAIVETLENLYNARFLRPVPNGWKELSRARARDKVSHALRWVVVGKERTARARSMRRQGSRRFDGSKSPCGSLTSTLSTESEPSILWEDWDDSKLKQRVTIESQRKINLQRRRSFPPMDDTGRPINVAEAVSGPTQRRQTKPNTPVVPTMGDQHYIQSTAGPVVGKLARSPGVSNTTFSLSPFDEVLTSSKFASLVRAPIIPDRVEGEAGECFDY